MFSVKIQNTNATVTEPNHDWLYDKLACPACFADIHCKNKSTGEMTCSECGKKYGWIEQIPVLLDSELSDPGIERLSAIWNSAAPIWSSMIKKPLAVFRTAEYPILDALSGDILEIGCGDGRLFPEYQQRDCRVVGLDFAPAMLQKALQFGFPLLLADAHRIPLREDSMDGIIVPFSTIRYLDYSEFFRQAARVLRGGGVIGLTAWNQWYNFRYRSRETTDWRSGRDVESIRELIDPLEKEGFSIKSIFGVFSFPPWIPLLRRICFRLPGNTGARLSRDIVIIAQRKYDT
jgi:SAM-dependent methyltransferase